MPGGNRKGPWGTGPRTGRGMGYCAGFPGPGFSSPGPGVGFGRGMGLGFGRGMGFGFGRGMGFGRGRGWRQAGFAPFWGYPLPQITPSSQIPGFRSLDDPWGATILTPENELNLFKAEAEQLEDELAGIEKRIKELEGEKK